MKSAFYKDAITWGLGRGPKMTKKGADLDYRS